MTASPPPEPSPPRRHRIAPTRRLCLLIAAVGSLLLFSPLATTQPTLAGATRSLAALLNLGLLFAFLSDYRRAGGAARSLIVRRHLEERLSLGGGQLVRCAVSATFLHEAQGAIVGDEEASEEVLG